MELVHHPEQATGSQGLWAVLHGSSATLLVPLAARARAVGRWPALGWQDPEAQRIAALAPQDLAPLVQDDALVRSIVLRSQYIDQQVLQACAQGPVGTVVTLGAGLCTRYSRLHARMVQPPQAWLHVDLPDVVRLRKACMSPHRVEDVYEASLTDLAWLHAAQLQPGCMHILVLEGVLPYLPAHVVLPWLRDVAEHFQSAGLQCRLLLDFLHPAMVGALPHSAGGMNLPVCGAFVNAAALAASHPAWQVLDECHPFAEFSDNHRAFAAQYHALHGAAPYTLACFGLV